jgi:hypothetical protein
MIFNPQTFSRCKKCGVDITQFHPNSTFDKRSMIAQKDIKCPQCKGETFLIYIKGINIRSLYHG